MGADFLGPIDEFPSMILKELKDGTLVKFEVPGDDDLAWYVFDPKNRHNLACARRDGGVTKWRFPGGEIDV